MLGSFTATRNEMENYTERGKLHKMVPILWTMVL